MPQASLGILSNHSLLISQVQLLALLWIVTSATRDPIECSLTQNYEKSSSNGSSCVPCPECPEEHGSSVPCGSKITDSTNIQCVLCELTKTFSDTHGIGSCKPCRHCGLRNVIKECTLYQDRKCGNECPQGYHFDTNITDCREATLASATTKSIELTPSITPQRASLMAGITSTAMKSPPLDYDASKSISTKKETTREKKHKTSLLLFFVLVVPVVMVLLAIFALTIIYRATRCKESQRTEPRGSAEKIPLHSMRGTVDTESYTSQETNYSSDDNCRPIVTQGNDLPEVRIDQGQNAACTSENDIPEDVKLADFPSYGEDFVLKLDCDTMALSKNWKHVACRFGLSNLDVQLLEKENGKPGGSPTRALIEKLCTTNVSLKRFVDVLRGVERRDVADDILNWFRKNYDR